VFVCERESVCGGGRERGELKNDHIFPVVCVCERETQRERDLADDVFQSTLI